MPATWRTSPSALLAARHSDREYYSKATPAPLKVILALKRHLCLQDFISWDNCLLATRLREDTPAVHQDSIYPNEIPIVSDHMASLGNVPTGQYRRKQVFLAVMSRLLPTSSRTR